MELTQEQARIVNEYYSCNARKLKNIIDGMIRRFGGIYDKDKDDFYSVGNETFVGALSTYKNGDTSFDAYLSACLKRGVMAEMTRRNYAKRSAAEITQDDVYTIEVKSTTSTTPTEDEVVYKQLISNLPDDEKTIVDMRLRGMRDYEIRKITGWSQNKFYRRLKSLYKRFDYALA